MVKIQLHRRNILYITLGAIACFFLSITTIVVTTQPKGDSLKTENASEATTSPPEESSLRTTSRNDRETTTTSSSDTQTTPEKTTEPLNTPGNSSDQPTQTDQTARLAQSSPNIFEPLRNTNPIFTKYADRPASEISLTTPGLTTPGKSNNDGSQSGGQGQFRAFCQYSHFAYDDPIIQPGKPGASHLHMFFGNTETDAYSTAESLLNTGGGTCQGFELNRSAYWVPALIDGEGNVVVPDSIVLYYKEYLPGATNPLPAGLEMIAGNVDKNNFESSPKLFWSCGKSGVKVDVSNQIQACGGHQYLNATIAFPNCWDGRNLSTDDMSHLAMASDKASCPSSHPVRFPQISILLYYPAASNVDGWHLSSDNESFRSGSPSLPGGTLHADWFGAWNDNAMDLFINGCIKSVKNCSGGQTGTPNQFTKVGNYEGDNYLKLPADSYQRK